MVLSDTPLHDLGEIVGRDQPHLEQVLRLDLATCLVKASAFP